MDNENDVYAALGKVVMDFAFMEWLIASLVAAVEGRERDYAEDLCKRPGAAMRALKVIAESRPELLRLHEDADALRERRNLLTHSIAMVGSDLRHNRIYLYWHPKTDEESTLYADDLLELAKKIKGMCGQLYLAAQERSLSSWWSGEDGEA